MTRFRRRMRLWAAAWLAIQAVTLVALVPGECCTSHARTATTAGTRPSADVHCPMRSADGAVCPMHRARARETSPAATAVLKCGCQGPKLFTLFAAPGVLSTPVTTCLPPEITTVTADIRGSLVLRSQPPDPPPPRA